MAEDQPADEGPGEEERRYAEEENRGSLISIRTGPATEEEKKLLRSTALARKATEDEVEGWLAASNTHMSEKARTAFHGMTPENQYRVMYEGPLTESRDSTEILYARVQRFMDMESQLKKLANATDEKSEAGNSKKVKASELAVAIGKAIVNPVLPDEVPEHERRFAPAVGTKMAPEPKAAPPLVGKLKGVGGIIEALQKKYSLQKGDRIKVVAETKELWKLEGEKTVPKTHQGQGWKWVLPLGDEPAKKKPKKAEEPAKPPAGEKARQKSERRSRDASRSRKGDKDAGKKKAKGKDERKRGRSRSSSSGSASGDRRRGASSKAARRASASASGSRSRSRSRGAKGRDLTRKDKRGKEAKFKARDSSEDPRKGRQKRSPSSRPARSPSPRSRSARRDRRYRR